MNNQRQSGPGFARGMADFYILTLTHDEAVGHLRAMVSTCAWFLHASPEPDPEKACRQAQNAEMFTRIFCDLLNERHGWTFDINQMLAEIRL